MKNTEIKPGLRLLKGTSEYEVVEATEHLVALRHTEGPLVIWRTFKDVYNNFSLKNQGKIYMHGIEEIIKNLMQGVALYVDLDGCPEKIESISFFHNKEHYIMTVGKYVLTSDDVVYKIVKKALE